MDKLEELIKKANEDLASNEYYNNIIDEVRIYDADKYEEAKKKITDEYKGHKDELISEIDRARDYISKKDKANDLIKMAEDKYKENPENEESVNDLFEALDIIDELYGKIPTEEYQALTDRYQEVKSAISLTKETNLTAVEDLESKEFEINPDTKSKIDDKHNEIIELAIGEKLDSEINLDKIRERLDDIDSIIKELPDSPSKEKIEEEHKLYDKDIPMFYTIKHTIDKAPDINALNSYNNMINLISNERLIKKLNEFVNEKKATMDIDSGMELVEEDIKQDDEKVEEIIKPQVKYNAPELTWKTAAMVAAGVGLGAGVFFVAGPGGCAALTVAGLIAKNMIRKKRKRLAEQRITNPEQFEEVESIQGISEDSKLGEILNKLKRYLNSDEGLRDLEWLASAASLSSGVLMGPGVFNVLDFHFAPLGAAIAGGIGSTIGATALNYKFIKESNMRTPIKVSSGKTDEEIAEEYGVEVDNVEPAMQEENKKEEVVQEKKETAEPVLYVDAPTEPELEEVLNEKRGLSL